MTRDANRKARLEVSPVHQSASRVAIADAPFYHTPNGKSLQHQESFSVDFCTGPFAAIGIIHLT